MSDTTMSAAMTSARRAASGSASLFKTVAGFRRGAREEALPEPANDEPAPTPVPPPSVISAKAHVVGSFTTPEELHVAGAIEGDLRASKITVLAGGTVKGGLMADEIVIHGAVEGRVHAMHVRLCAGAIVSGEIHHTTLGIDTAAVFEGTIKREPTAIAAE